MEKEAENVPSGIKQSNLKTSFRQCIRSLLTAFPSEDFPKVFPKFTGAQQEQLYQLYIQIIASMHELAKDEFDSICDETHAGTILDTIEHFVEEQSLDPLSSQKTNIKDVKQDLLSAKKNEIRVLQDLLDKAEDKKHSIKARIKLLRKTREETSAPTDAVEKLRSMMASYAA